MTEEVIPHSTRTLSFCNEELRGDCKKINLVNFNFAIEKHRGGGGSQITTLGDLIVCILVDYVIYSRQSYIEGFPDDSEAVPLVSITTLHA